uniref:Uncharacterized protein n=1 Tax=Cannabis sativa TaxID=3483 RepID=A0A803R374_CANSA
MGQQLLFLDLALLFLHLCYLCHQSYIYLICPLICFLLVNSLVIYIVASHSFLIIVCLRIL